MKRILVAIFNQEHWHQSVAIDLAISHLKKQDVVTILDYSNLLNRSSHKVYVSNTTKKVFPSSYPILQIVTRLKKEYKNIFSYADEMPLNLSLSRKNISSKKVYDAVFKDLVSETKSYNPDLNTFEDKFRKKEIDFLKLYNFLIKYVDSKFDLVYTYNGRFLYERALWEACLKTKIPIKFHDRFVLGWNDKYWIWESSVHDTKYRAEVVRNFSKSSELYAKNNSKINIRVKKWVTAREDSITQPYTSNQKIGFTRPDGYKYLVSFYTSSEDELIYSNLKSLDWPSQGKTVERLIKLFQKKNIYFVVRVHPNLQHKSASTQIYWSELKKSVSELDNVKIILPLDKVKSYDLLNSSDVVITSGSTIGLEAVLRGKPMLLLGKSLYDGLDIGVKCKNINEFKTKFLKVTSPDFRVNKQDAISYINFLELGGIKFQNGKIDLKNNSTNQVLDPNVYFYGSLTTRIPKWVKIPNKFFSKNI